MAFHLTRYVWAMPMPGLRKLVLLALADHADQETRRCWPGVALLARRCGLSERAVREHLRGLEDDGLIVQVFQPVGGRGRATVYAVLPEFDTDSVPQQNPAPRAPFSAPDDSEKGAPRAGYDNSRTDNSSERGQIDARKGAPRAPQSVEPESPRARAREEAVGHAPANAGAPDLLEPNTGSAELDDQLRTLRDTLHDRSPTQR